MEDYFIVGTGLILYPKPEHRFSVSVTGITGVSKEGIEFGILSKSLIGF